MVQVQIYQVFRVPPPQGLPHPSHTHPTVATLTATSPPTGSGFKTSVEPSLPKVHLQSRHCMWNLHPGHQCPCYDQPRSDPVGSPSDIGHPVGYLIHQIQESLLPVTMVLVQINQGPLPLPPSSLPKFISPIATATGEIYSHLFLFLSSSPSPLSFTIFTLHLSSFYSSDHPVAAKTTISTLLPHPFHT